MSKYQQLRHLPADSERRDPRGVAPNSHGKKNSFTARPTDPWVVNNTTRYPFQVGARPDKPPLKSGYNNAKIGKRVLKGKWIAAPIWTLTLTERATCGPCGHKNDCYGNAMLNAHRQEHGPELLKRIRAQLGDLQREYPDRFLVRLHVLGDFYSVEYVEFWATMLDHFPGLRVYGYTARKPGTPIGNALLSLFHTYRKRFAMRWSDYESNLPATVSIRRKEDCPPDSFVCPAQVEKLSHCGSCTACWEIDKRVAFLDH